MPGGLGPRFALEAGFLILLAAVAAYARLEATEIILVMAGGWVLVSVFEVLAARRERLFPDTSWERRVETDEPDAPEDELEAERRLSWFRRSVDATEQEVDEAVSSEPLPTPPPAPPPPPDDEATGEIELPKRRRWFGRGRSEPEAGAGGIEARPSARHVRLIRATPPEGAASEHAGENHEQKDVETGQ